MSDIADRVKTVIANTLGLDRDQVSFYSEFWHGLNADSLDCVEIQMALVEEFNMDIRDDVADRITTVLQVVEDIEAHSSKH